MSIIPCEHKLDCFNLWKKGKQEMEAKFASGAESLDNFDAFVEQLKNLGLERAIEIQQKAYDNYLKR